MELSIDSNTNKNISELFYWGLYYLRERNIENSHIDAEVLLSETLNMSLTEIYKNWKIDIKKNEKGKYLKFIKRRGNREPLSYIIGKKEFYSLDFVLSKNVLIPRPDTELLVEKAIQTLLIFNKEDVFVAEIGTGSGIISVCLAKEIEKIKIIATDISIKAIKIAKRNSKIHNVENKISFINGNLLEAFKKSERLFNLVISNPPYISFDEFKEVSDDIKNYEPKEALLAGDGGLEFHTKLIKTAPEFLVKGGALMLEIGYNQSNKLKDIIKNTGNKLLSEPVFYKDISGIERVLELRVL